MNLSVLPASCRQKKLGSADERSAAHWRGGTLDQPAHGLEACPTWRSKTSH